MGAVARAPDAQGRAGTLSHSTNGARVDQCPPADQGVAFSPRLLRPLTLRGRRRCERLARRDWGGADLGRLGDRGHASDPIDGGAGNGVAPADLPDRAPCGEESTGRETPRDAARRRAGPFAERTRFPRRRVHVASENVTRASENVTRSVRNKWRAPCAVCPSPAPSRKRHGFPGVVQRGGQGWTGLDPPWTTPGHCWLFPEGPPPPPPVHPPSTGGRGVDRGWPGVANGWPFRGRGSPWAGGYAHPSTAHLRARAPAPLWARQNPRPGTRAPRAPSPGSPASPGASEGRSRAHRLRLPGETCVRGGVRRRRRERARARGHGEHEAHVEVQLRVDGAPVAGLIRCPPRVRSRHRSPRVEAWTSTASTARSWHRLDGDPSTPTTSPAAPRRGPAPRQRAPVAGHVDAHHARETHSGPPGSATLALKIATLGPKNRQGGPENRHPGPEESPGWPRKSPPWQILDRLPAWP